MRYRNDKPQLAKRGKVVCPQCGKKTFVNYVYSDGTPVASGVCGKCDRADKCNYHYPPREYFKDNEIPKPTEYYTRFKPQRKRPEITTPSFIESSLMLDTMRGYEMNPFAMYLHSIFDEVAGAELVQANIERYAVGTSSRYNGSAIFWQIDQYGRIRSGQILGYDSTTGKRDHNQQNWVHYVNKDKYPDFNLEQCYFGSHLIKKATEEVAEIHKEYQEANLGECQVEPCVYLFESPKAAIIMSIALMWGGCRMTVVPMATCSCGNFNPTSDHKVNLWDKVQVLKGRKVVLFPDNGKFEEWKTKGEQLKGFAKEVWISTAMERILHPYEIECEIENGDGFDDLILRYVKAGKPIWDLITTCYGYRGQWRIV